MRSCLKARNPERGSVYPSAEAARVAGEPRATVEDEKALVFSLIRAADYRGSDVRLDSGELYRPNTWPASALTQRAALGMS